MAMTPHALKKGVQPLLVVSRHSQTKALVFIRERNSLCRRSQSTKV